MKYITYTLLFIALLLCSCNSNKAANEREQSEACFDSAECEQTRPKVKLNDTQSSEAQTEDTMIAITEDMAFECVSNYCHKEYDWSVAKDNPDIMHLQIGEEMDSAYQVVFRSYTGAFVLFYVNKTSGTIRIVEKVPSLNIEEEAGTINLFDYLDNPPL